MTTRRLLSMLATAAVGVVGALAFASPASAHDLTVQGSTDCQSEPGTSTVTWKFTNTWDHDTATIKSISATVNGVEVGMEIAKGASVTGTQVVHGQPGEKVTLTVSAHWSDNYPEHGNKVIVSDPVELKGPCEQPPSPKPSASPSAPAPVSQPASAPASSPASPGLPVTGTPTIAVAGVALVLIAGGTLLVLLGRRRRGAAQ